MKPRLCSQGAGWKSLCIKKTQLPDPLTSLYAIFPVLDPFLAAILLWLEVWAQVDPVGLDFNLVKLFI